MEGLGLLFQRHERSVAYRRVTTFGWLDTLIRPQVPGDQQSSPREPLVGRVCVIETHAHRPGESHARKEGRRASTSAAMFEAGEVVEPHIGGLRRRSAQPVCDNE